MKRLVSSLIVVAGCWGGRSAPEAPSPRMPETGEAEWTVEVEAPADAQDFDFGAVTEAVATRGPRPVVFAGALFSTDKPRVVATSEGPRPTRDGELLGVVQGEDAATVTTLRGERFTIPYALVPKEARWYDLAPGILAVQGTEAGARFTRFDGGRSSPSWVHDAAAAGVTSVRRVGWFDGGDPLFALDHEAASNATLLRLAAAKGSSATLATVPKGRIAFSPRTGQLAVVFDAPRAGCEACSRAEVYDLRSGKQAAGFGLLAPGDATASDVGTVGFDGKVLWMYSYRAEVHTDFGLQGSESCGYDAYDVATGQHFRTLSSAARDWRRISAGCRVRALLPMADGGALAFALLSNQERRVARVYKFAAPP